MTDDLMGAISAEITMRMTKTQNAFVMETIIPFLQQRTELEISKEELIDALQKSKQEAVIRRKAFKDGEVVGTVEFCPTCLHAIDNGKYGTSYCCRCGQHLEWNVEDEDGQS